MVAILVERIGHEQIAKLTPRQIMDHYFHPRDEKGNPVQQDERHELSEELTDEEADFVALAFAESIGADTAGIRETIRKREEMKAHGSS